MADLSLNVEAYAALAAALASPGVDRSALLAAHGLDEDGWDALDDAWQSRFLEADDEEALGVPSLLAAYAEAFSRAQRSRSSGLLSFDRFLEAAREMKRGNDLATALKRLDTTLEAFLESQAHWTSKMLEDDELAARFRKTMR